MIACISDKLQFVVYEMKVGVLTPISPGFPSGQPRWGGSKRQTSATQRRLPPWGPWLVCRTLPKLLSFLVIWISLCTCPVRSQITEKRVAELLMSQMTKNSEAVSKLTAD